VLNPPNPCGLTAFRFMMSSHRDEHRNTEVRTPLRCKGTNK
jgi:hypothetical protein